MSHWNMQLNYFPSWLESYLPPTDTRRRPDQRCLEMGDLVRAAQEKLRLEEKQRAARKVRENSNIEWRPSYFKEYTNNEDGKTYYIYNGNYWEKDRREHNWERLPDIFSD